MIMLEPGFQIIYYMVTHDEITFSSIILEF